MEITLQVDDDGFLRRQCPKCSREFKQLTRDDEESGGGDNLTEYFCPYCGVSAPPNEWWTVEQLAVVESVVMNQVVEPELDGLRKQLADLGRRSDSFVTADVRVERNKPPVPHEANDMRRVDFICHPDEPVKIAESWSELVHCPACGQMRTVAHLGDG